jgi:hypothetical protein
MTNTPNNTEATKAGDLLPCPFCGAPAARGVKLRWPVQESCGFSRMHVSCSNSGCGAHFSKWHESEWNRRSTPPAEPTSAAEGAFSPSDCITKCGSGEPCDQSRCPLPDPAQSADTPPSFQNRVALWMQECFGPEISADRLERNDRFVEEALELVQACGYAKDRAHALVEYVFNRPVGHAPQEVGGVMVTLAALCLAHGYDMHAEGETELLRIGTPEIIAKIRAKQAAKPTGSALPIAPQPNGPHIGTSPPTGYEDADTPIETSRDICGRPAQNPDDPDDYV